MYCVNYAVNYNVLSNWLASARFEVTPIFTTDSVFIYPLQTEPIKSLCVPFRRASSLCAWMHLCHGSLTRCIAVGQLCRCCMEEAAAGTVETAGLTKPYRWGEQTHIRLLLERIWCRFQLCLVGLGSCYAKVECLLFQRVFHVIYHYQITNHSILMSQWVYDESI